MGRALSFVLSVVATIAVPSLGLGDLLFDGAEFQINTYTTAGQVGIAARSVARAPDGSFVVVWQSFGQDGDYTGIHGQRFDSAGAPAGTEFQVNTYTTSFQHRAAVAQANDGRFVVVWQSNGQDGDDASIQGQRFDSTGAAAGTEFQVNTYTTYSQDGPALAQANDGSFVVVWASFGQDGDYTGIHSQRFDSTGAPAGTEFQVNTYTTLSQARPAVSQTSDGSFIVVWDSSEQDGSDFGVHGQRFGSAGTTAGTEFQVNTYTTAPQAYPAISAAADGSFVVVWNSYGQDGYDVGVQGQRFDSTGAAAGTEFLVNTYTTYSQYRPAVAQASDGSFVVVWDSSGQDGSAFSIHGQRYDSSGAAYGTEFQVNTYTTGYQGISNSVAVDAAGDFVVVWMNYDQDFYGMFGQRLCQDANSNLACDSQETTTTSTSTTTSTLPASPCGAAPAAGCVTGAKVSFQLKDSSDDKDQIKWKLSKGGAVDHVALGNPVTTRAYSLCIYDETAGAPSLVGSLTIDPNANWDDKDPKGFSNKDKAGAEDGVTKASIRTGDAGKSAASISARGTNIPMPAPLSMTEFFDIDTAVTVQLVNDETSLCWTSEFTVATKNDGVQFKAKAP